MKINNNNIKQPLAAQVNAKDLEKNLETKGKSKSDASSSLFGSTSVKMSPEAQAFQKAKAIASTDTVDDAKVERLQKLIDAGKYNVSAEAIADRLVDEHIMAGE
ncbi:MAG: flagellar biosynthesis anti-sigma factor FlgM [Bdellovibrionales bacterium]|nr:flagellar biosynthesis anti-sigma factor FlgM [Bdellovibrionales bacterium]